MPPEIDQTGATPVVPGAMPGQAGQTGSAGATPGAATSTTPAAGTTPPATNGSADATSQGYPDGLGDAGKRALDAERGAREAAEARASDATKELEKLRRATQTDQEKAVDEARTEGWTKAANLVRQAEVRRALTAAGCRFVDLAAKADEFSGLEVTESGAVKDLDRAIEKFKTANADAFGAAARPTDYGGGPRGTAAPGATDMNTLIRRGAGRG